jgi:hypothetical protein
MARSEGGELGRAGNKKPHQMMELVLANNRSKSGLNRNSMRQVLVFILNKNNF